MNAEQLKHQEFMALHKGAGIAILLTLFRLGGPFGAQDLGELCCYAQPAIRASLKKLANHDLIQRLGYRNSWVLTAHGRQLSLFNGLPAPLEENLQVSAPLEENLQVAGMYVGSLNIKDSYIHTPTTTNPLEENLQVDEGARHAAVQALVSLGRVGTAKADAAVVRALIRGDEPAVIMARIAACAEYCRRNKSILAPGGWSADYVSRGLDPAVAVPEPALPALEDPAPADDELDPEPQVEPEPAAPLSEVDELWQRALPQVAMEIPMSTYDTHVAGARLLRIEPGPERDLYVIGAANPPARDWMANRLTSILGRALTVASAEPNRLIDLAFEVRGG